MQRLNMHMQDRHFLFLFETSWFEDNTMVCLLHNMVASVGGEDLLWKRNMQ